MIDKYTRWAELTDLDGFRIDTVKHVEYEFWTEFATQVRARLAAQGKNKSLMFGEAFDGNDKLLGSYTQPGMLDSVFYFSQHFQVFRDVFQSAHDENAQKGTDQIQKLWADRAVNYNTEPQAGGTGVAPSKSLVNFLDNHDVSRFLFEALGDKPEGIMGVSVGDSEAWVLGPVGIDRLTEKQNRKRLGGVGSSATLFHRPTLDGMLVVGTDGLFKNARPELSSAASGE